MIKYDFSFLENIKPFRNNKKRKKKEDINKF